MGQSPFGMEAPFCGTENKTASLA